MLAEAHRPNGGGDVMMDAFSLLDPTSFARSFLFSITLMSLAAPPFASPGPVLNFSY